MKRTPFLLLLGLVLFLSERMPLLAWDTEEVVPVTIIVVDQAGAAVPHAQIQLASGQSLTPENPKTNEFGRMTLHVVPGKYVLLADAPHFSHQSEIIEVEPGVGQTINVTMQVASTPSEIQVGSPGPPIQIVIEAISNPEPPIGVLPLSPARSPSLTQIVPPFGTHKSALARKSRVPYHL